MWEYIKGQCYGIVLGFSLGVLFCRVADFFLR